MADAACEHESAIVVRGSLLLPDDGEPDSFDAAWCPACGAFREASAFSSDPCKWEVPVVSRGKRPACGRCGGTGEIPYAATSGASMRPGGMAITSGPCPKCQPAIDPADDVKEPKEAADV